MNVQPTYDKLVAMIRKKIETDNRTQREIGEASDVPQPVIARFMSSPEKTLQTHTLDKLAKLYGISAKVVLEPIKPKKRAAKRSTTMPPE